MAEPFLRKFLEYTNQKRQELAMTQIEWEDVICFTLSHIWMGTRQLPRISDYFSMDELLCDKFLTDLRKKNGFSGNKLRTIFRTVRLYDKTECRNSGKSDTASTSYDPGYKYREVLEELTKAAQEHFKPYRELSIDESMDLFKVC